MNKKAMYNLSYGLFVLTARSGEKDNGCIINTAGQVTSTPNRITVTVNKENYTNDMICESGKFNISVLSERADFALFRHFGFQSGRTVDKFADYSACKRSENGLYYITQGTNAYLSATVEQTIDLGSHTMFIASVEDMDVLSQDPSATYAYYQSSIKPKPEQEQKVSGGKVVWRCTICGFVYEGEELPPDYVCPLCKHPASDFERVVL
ncbi:MAG: flavin reductase [Eubacteriales bacterium]|nr:flavin reductase [Eubacteriales bacterium]